MIPMYLAADSGVPVWRQNQYENTAIPVSTKFRE